MLLDGLAQLVERALVERALKPRLVRERGYILGAARFYELKVARERVLKVDRRLFAEL